MIRVTKMTGKYYGVVLTDDAEKEMEDIAILVGEGTPVILVDSVSELEELEIYEEVIMVDRDE